jgi:hypothetical protein
MPTFRVRFKGILNKDERTRLAEAGITLVDSQPSAMRGIPGRPIYTVRLEATSEDEALAKVREALDPDTGNFADWEAGPS